MLRRRSAIAHRSPATKPAAKVAKLKKLIQQSLDDDKALDIAVVDLAGKSSIADFMIVASGTSQKHISSIAENLAERVQEMGIDYTPMEGKGTSDWVVLDVGAIIVHIFKPEARQHYNLEKMWGMPELATEAAL